jgi:hypothetical protein
MCEILPCLLAQNQPLSSQSSLEIEGLKQQNAI